MDNRNTLEEMKRQSELAAQIKKEGIEAFLKPHGFNPAKIPEYRAKMKEKIITILMKHDQYFVDQMADEILDLF